MVFSILLWLFAVLSTGFYPVPVQASGVHDHHDMNPHDHFGTEPIGVMGAHAHGRGD